MVSAIRKVKRRERGLIFLGLHRKPIKLLTRNLLCSWRLQVPSRWGEDAGRPLPGEDAGHFPYRVLEAQAKKWTQRASVPQGVIWKKKRERKKEWHRETKLRWARPITLFWKGTFIAWLVHRGKWKMQSHAESAQTLHLFCLYRNQDFFCIPFP